MTDLLYGMATIAAIVIAVTLFLWVDNAIMDWALRVFPGFAEWFNSLPLNK